MIRDAGTNDISEIRELMKSVAGFWDESWRPDVLERALDSPDGIALVHEDRTGIDAFICAHDVGFRAYLSELIVAPRRSDGGSGHGFSGRSSRASRNVAVR